MQWQWKGGTVSVDRGVARARALVRVTAKVVVRATVVARTMAM